MILRIRPSNGCISVLPQLQQGSAMMLSFIVVTHSCKVFTMDNTLFYQKIIYFYHLYKPFLLRASGGDGIHVHTYPTIELGLVRAPTIALV
jgi:hypothetical protein